MADPSNGQSMPSSSQSSEISNTLPLAHGTLAVKSQLASISGESRPRSESPIATFSRDSPDLKTLIDASTTASTSASTTPVMSSTVVTEKPQLPRYIPPPPPKPQIQPHLLQQQPRNTFGSPHDIAQPVPVICTSKKWVLPPRPKPGRKPSQDPPAVKRKAQNRAAQKAYRERRAAAVAAGEAATTSPPTPEVPTTTTSAASGGIDGGKKKKLTKSQIKELELLSGSALIKMEPEDDVSLMTLNLNESSSPSDQIIKKEELFSMASCTGSTFIKTEETSDYMAAKLFSSTLRSSYSPQIKLEEKDEEEQPQKCPPKKMTKSERVIKDLRTALAEANQENHRLNLLINELRAEVTELTDLKTAEKDFVYHHQSDKHLMSPVPGGGRSGSPCRLCKMESSVCVCNSLSLKANPFFGGKEVSRSSVLLDVDMFLNDGSDVEEEKVSIASASASATPANDWTMVHLDAVPLPRRKDEKELINERKKSASTLPKFKRLQAGSSSSLGDDQELDFTNVYSKRTGYSPKTTTTTTTAAGAGAAPSSISSSISSASSWLGSSEISPNSDASTPMTSEDELHHHHRPLHDLCTTTSTTTTTTTTNTKPQQLNDFDDLELNPSAGGGGGVLKTKGKRMISMSAACCKKQKKTSTSSSVSGTERKKPRVFIDPCGFCSKGTPCLCLEAAVAADQADSSDF